MNKKLCHGGMICRAKQTQVCRTLLWTGTHNSGSTSQSCISCIDDHEFKKEVSETLEELSDVRSQIVLTCLYLVRLGRPDLLLTVNSLAGSVTPWRRACEKRFSRMVALIHHTGNYRYLGLFQDADCAGDLPDSKSTSGGVLCMFRSQTLVPISSSRQKQATVSHSSTETEHFV